MKIANPFFGLFVFCALLHGLCGPETVAAGEGNIDNSEKYAWSENAGWENFRPTNGGVTVRSQYLSGYAWAENLGWVKLGSGAGPYQNTTTDNWGVNRNPATGALSGYAWSELAGWINFNPTYSHVIIDPATGSFDGYAWSENAGWIHLNGAAPAYNVAVARPASISFSPPAGTTGALITITGGNLLEASSVTFGGTEAAEFTVHSAGSITATIGAGSSGKVAVTTPGGSAESAADFIYTAAPVVTTMAVSDITTKSASCGGTIVSDGGTPVTARGVCWSESLDPTIADSHTADGSGIGTFVSSITGLTPSRVYHVRAYATNSDGTAYGADVSFSTIDAVIPTLTGWGMIALSVLVLSAAVWLTRRRRVGTPESGACRL